jgi:beta-xylosidase
VRGDSKPFRNFVISTKDISQNSWTKPVFFDFNGIDPSLFFDDDGKAYIQGAFVMGYHEQPSTTIKQFQIDLATGQALSQQTVIWSGFAKISTEGPHMYKRDGQYYLVVAEGGTFDGHMVSIARSKHSVWGPFESYDHNPLLTAHNTNQLVQYTGHADLFQAKDGNWHAVLLGVRKIKDRYPLGRETFLTDVSWPEGEFPQMSPIGDISRNGLAVTIRNPLKSRLVGHEIIYIRNPNIDAFHFEPNGSFSISPCEVGLDSPIVSPSFAGCRQRSLNCIISVDLESASDINVVGSNLQGGIAVYKDEFRYAFISFDFKTKSMNFVTKHVAAHQSTCIQETVEDVKNLKLRIVCTELSYSFEYSIDDNHNNYRTLGAVDTTHFTWDDFTGTIFGVFVKGVGPSLRFRDFQCTERSEMVG